MIIQDIIEKINPRNNKIVLFALIVSVLIVLLVIMINVLITTLENKGKAAPPHGRQASHSASVFIPSESDLKIPPNFLRDPEFTWRSFRVTPDKWVHEDIERFWQDPSDVIIEAYSKENKELITNILRGVP